MAKELKIIEVTFEEFSEYDFNPPSAFYVRDSTGDFKFICTRDRVVAQQWVDDNYGAGRYKVVAARTVKTKSRREDGGYSAVGSSTRKCYVKKN